MKSSYIDDTR